MRLTRYSSDSDFFAVGVPSGRLAESSAIVDDFIHYSQRFEHFEGTTTESIGMTALDRRWFSIDAKQRQIREAIASE